MNPLDEFIAEFTSFLCHYTCEVCKLPSENEGVHLYLNADEYSEYDEIWRDIAVLHNKMVQFANGVVERDFRDHQSRGDDE